MPAGAHERRSEKSERIDVKTGDVQVYDVGYDTTES